MSSTRVETADDGHVGLAAINRTADVAPLLYYVSPGSGRLAPLVMQSFQDVHSLPPTRLWERLTSKPPSPTTTLGKMSYWIAAPVLEQGRTEMKFADKRAVGRAVLRLVMSWPLSCVLCYGFEFMASPFSDVLQLNSLHFTKRDPLYQPARQLGSSVETAARQSRAAAESSSSAPIPQRRAYTDDIDLDTDLNASPSTSNEDAHTIVFEGSGDQGTASRPRYLCYIADPERDAEYETINVSNFLDKEGDDVDIEFVFVSYTREQFRVATDEEIDRYAYPDEATREANRQLAHQDRDVLTRWGLDAARRAGKRAFWIDFECVRDEDGVARSSSKSGDVYRICDVVRAAHSMIIAIGPPASEKVNAILCNQENFSSAAGQQQATTKWLRHWGSRLWTLPELLLCPSEHRVKLYVLGQDDAAEPIALAKRNFAERAWDDAELVKELVNHYEGSAILSQIRLIETALQCFAHRGTHQFSPGDIAYALMGLLPLSQRPAVHPGDTGFQAFARLCLANDGGEFLSRMVCLLPPKHSRDDAAWYENVKDLWGARIRDVHPTSRVVKLAPDVPDTLILDGAPSAAIRWDAFDTHVIREGEMPKSKFPALLLIWMNILSLLAIGVLFLASLLARRLGGEFDASALPGLRMVIVVIGAPAILSPLLYLWYQRKNTRQHMEARLVGVEGYIDAGVVERHFWGHDGGRLALIEGTETGYQDDDDANMEEETGNERDKTDFTLVDTHMMSIMHISAYKPPVAVFAVGSVAGMQRMLLCSYDWRTDTFEREIAMRVESRMLEKMRHIDQFRLRLRSSPAVDDHVEPTAAAVAPETHISWRKELLFVFLILLAVDTPTSIYAMVYGRPRLIWIPISVAFIVAMVQSFFIATRMSLERTVPQLIIIRALLPGLFSFVEDEPNTAAWIARWFLFGVVGALLYPLLVALLWLWWWPSPGHCAARLLTFHICAFMLHTVGLYSLLDVQISMMLQLGIAAFGRRIIGAPAEVGWLDGREKMALAMPSSLKSLRSLRKQIIPLILFVVSVLAHLATNTAIGSAGFHLLLLNISGYAVVVALLSIWVSRSQKSIMMPSSTAIFHISDCVVCIMTCVAQGATFVTVGPSPVVTTMSGNVAAPKKTRPSQRWTSFDDWNYGGMRQRLDMFMASINKTALTEHASAVLGSPASMSEPFSAGQYWCCFELVAPDDRFLIARVRLPKHPHNATDAAEEYLIQCEVATMKFLRENVKTVPSPTLYACEAPGSARALSAGAAYMLIEGFHGNSLQDVHQSIYHLPISTQEHLFTQWTSFQAELAAFTFPQIGSISQFSTDTGPIIGAIAASSIEGLPTAGPFQSGWDYFVAVAEGLVDQALQRKRFGTESNRFTTLGPLVFRNIVRDTKLFKSSQGPFHFNHMDMGMQNILIDHDYNFVAVIDWELAQSAPWEVNHYPMPIPLISSDKETAEILYEPGHIAHRNVSRQVGARILYQQKFKEAERALAKRGYPLHCSISEVLEGMASRIYGLVGKIGLFPGMEEELTYELVRLGYGLTGPEAEQYLEKLGAESSVLI
ncbi:3-hydroxyisobutyrate dehydrogenase protein [Cordyceps javanica]|uniref:3-hydroxyisobutyrate dehydrogenase protein n=1 Tax=Cordyceps javanica TaxID=43265 RepID=A0A545VIL1_9HYPO|nr:3-hydroxyisobutyrate dehydrogenase protein [Cordyceps javanica]TQW01574.1 phosphotransferase enzyme family [Cordyceps javanica]